jgi:hypothetical protein
VGSSVSGAGVSGNWDEMLSARIKAGEQIPSNSPWKITQYSDLSGLEYD